MTDETGTIDTEVAATGTLSAPVLAPDGVAGITGVTVAESDIAKASALVGLVINRDLTDGKWLATVSKRDLHLLQQAIAWQASDTPAVTTTTVTTGGAAATGGIDIPDSVKSVSLGDVSVTMRDVASSSSTTITSPICNLAMIAIARLSWRRRNTIKASPMILDEWVVQQRQNQQTLTDDGYDASWTPLGERQQWVGNSGLNERDV